MKSKSEDNANISFLCIVWANSSREFTNTIDKPYQRLPSHLQFCLSVMCIRARGFFPVELLSTSPFPKKEGTVCNNNNNNNNNL